MKEKVDSESENRNAVAREVLYSLSFKIVLHSLSSLIMLAKHLKERVHIYILIAQNVCMRGLPSKAENSVVSKVDAIYARSTEHQALL